MIKSVRYLRISNSELTCPLIGIGVAFYALFGIYRWGSLVALSGALVAALMFGVGYVMWMISSWAKDDIKLFTALCPLFPFYKASYVNAYYRIPHASI